MAKSTVLVLDFDNNEATGIYYDEFRDTFRDMGMKSMADVSRASHVEPCENGWNVDMTPFGGPSSIGVYETREEALAAEVEWLKAKMQE